MPLVTAAVSQLLAQIDDLITKLVIYKSIHNICCQVSGKFVLENYGLCGAISYCTLLFIGNDRVTIGDVSIELKSSHNSHKIPTTYCKFFLIVYQFPQQICNTRS